MNKSRDFLSVIDEDFKSELISIPDFYSGRSVFVTGATGFLGKVLVEKLIRSCPKIKIIYLLIRPKKSQSIENRLNEILQVPLFDKIREDQPKALSKVKAICGDIQSHNLGISNNDKKVLVENVSIVFHSAASVKFNEPLKDAVNINVEGTQKIMDLCREMKLLDVLVHVSTAYSNCERFEIDEVVYENRMKPHDLIDFVYKSPEEVLKNMGMWHLENRPNSYTYTKAVAENLVKGCKFPVVIVRPSIVLSTLNEPISGWLEGMNGPTGILVANAKGLLHSMYLRPNVIADFIPVDLVTNLIIASAWEKVSNSTTHDLKVYNIVSSNKNPVRWGDLVAAQFSTIRRYPFEGFVWCPSKISSTPKSLRSVYSTIVHLTPAFIVDLILLVCRKKPIFFKIQRKISQSLKLTEYFYDNEWKFCEKNVDTLFNLMNVEDRRNFNFDVTNICWPEYFEQYILGIRKFVCKQSPESIKSCRKRLMMFRAFHETIKIGFILFAVLFLINIFYALY